MINYEKGFKAAYGEIIEKYRMKLIVISGDDFLLIGRDYAFYIALHHDELNIWYICRDEQGQLMMDLMDFYFGEKYDAYDRRGLEKPAPTLQQEMEEQLMITARGIENHFSNILEGDKSWIEEYKKKNGDFDKPSKKLAQIVEKYF